MPTIAGGFASHRKRSSDAAQLMLTAQGCVADLTRRANHFAFAIVACQAPLAKIFLFFRS
jgi:hypothetical protein